MDTLTLNKNYKELVGNNKQTQMNRIDRQTNIGSHKTITTLK